EEQFGSALPIITYDDVDSTIDQINAGQYGLGASIWSQDLERAKRYANRLESGTVWINQHTVVELDAPFGGWKTSGLGRARPRWCPEALRAAPRPRPLAPHSVPRTPHPQRLHWLLVEQHSHHIDRNIVVSDIFSTELITLGTAAGPAIRGKENGMASAVVVGGQFYMIDFGLGCVRSAHEAGLRGQDFKAGFITHLHSDHVAELPGFLMWNWGEPVEGFDHPISIYGPGLDDRHPDGQELAGTAGLINHTLEAFSYDLRIRETDEARPVMSELIRP